MKKRILKSMKLSYIFALVIGALFMIQNVEARDIEKDLTLSQDITENLVVKSGKNVTIDLKILALVIISIALVVLIIYLIQVMRRLLVTLDKTNKILADAEIISDIAANRSKDVDGIISNVSESVASVSEAVKGNKNAFAAAAAVAKAVMAVKNAVTKEEEK